PTSTMLRGCSIACTRLTISLASLGGDHLPAERAEVAAWASIGVLSPRLLFCGTEFPFPRLGRKQTGHFVPRQHARAACRASGFAGRNKKKGAPTCAGAPQRSGHCRVCARTVVLGAAPRRRTRGRTYML